MNLLRETLFAKFFKSLNGIFSINVSVSEIIMT